MVPKKEIHTYKFNKIHMQLICRKLQSSDENVTEEINK